MASAMVNSTTCTPYNDHEVLCFNNTDIPFYYSPKSTLLEDVPDTYLCLAAPVLAYWFLSLFFHYFDMQDWKWLEKYRLHESAEVKAKNLVTRTQVIVAVIFQQIVQTGLGLLWLSEDKHAVNHSQSMQWYAKLLRPLVQLLVGDQGSAKLAHHMSYFAYWWAVPLFQLFAAMFIIDTWQYFLHRAMHVNKFLYKHFHSWHHRLYVPYAFGSLYNHPVEGFLLDSLGTAVAEAVCQMSSRQAMFLFSFAAFKTVDDHCGYRLPFDPFQLITGNNADYHDIHHQTAGIKSNFAQPFFVHWDTLLNTRMTREELESKKSRGKKVE